MPTKDPAEEDNPKPDSDASQEPQTENVVADREAVAEESSAQPAPAETGTAPAESAQLSFPIVGIGASAGGLAAFEAFFANMPAATESGIALVVVQHLDPGHRSILTELVRRYTRMTVFEVEDGMTVEPDCAYIIPPNKDMALSHGKLHLMEPSERRGLRLPIDFFFRSLAQDRGEQAICIVLSGTGTDGTLGLKAVKEAGGMAMVQEAESAAYDGMPRSAIATGLADYVLPPKEMPAQLIAYVKHVFGQRAKSVAAPLPDPSSWLPKITFLLRSHSGHDFSGYKQTTIRRRVEKRMAVNQIEGIDHYVHYLRQNPAESEALFRELLIGVTGFFRDPEAYDVLRRHTIPRLFADRQPGSPVRVWVPGCSTGEEAYSIAILLLEHANGLGRDLQMQIFATDIDREAIESARGGLYPSSISADVSPGRLARFFTMEGDNFYRIKKAVRDLVIFAIQDLTRDPPFSRVHLISCRNLLIYMEPDLQKRIVPILHYALNPGGFLMLGGAETTGEFAELFEAVNKKWKLYQRKEVFFFRPLQVALPGLPPPLAARLQLPGGAGELPRERKVGVRELAERTLLQEYTPACVVVNDRGEILYVHGRTGKYLELAPGEISVDILRTAREGLKLELATALRRVALHGEPVRYDGLLVRTNGETQRVDVVVRRSGSADAGLILVLFKDVPSEPEDVIPVETAPMDDKDSHIVSLERDLRIKDEYLRSTIEELETANEELKSTNEELQSTNEELQSTNEELETSKEELQSVNEELVTVNTELQQKVQQLSRANNDMNNLLAGTGIGTIFLDHELRIKRFTPAGGAIMNLIQPDLGRPVGHIVSNLADYQDLVGDVKAVLDSLMPREAEVQCSDGRWYLMRILPYRTLENVVEGAVITFVEITEHKRLREALAAPEHRLATMVRDANDAITVHDFEGKILAWNPSAARMYGWSQAEGLNMNILDIVPEEKRAEAAEFVNKLARGETVESFECGRITKDGRVLHVRLTGTALVDATGRPYAVATIEREHNAGSG